MKKQKKSKLGLGLVVGVAAGAAAAAYLSSKSGKRAVTQRKKQLQKFLKSHKLDDKAQSLWQQLSTQAVETYDMAKDELASQIENLKDSASSLTKDDYVKMVHEVVSKVKNAKNAPAEVIDKVQKELSSYWDALVGEGKTEDLVKKATPRVKKAVKKASSKAKKALKKR